jgi:hypothetical protein
VSHPEQQPDHEAGISIQEKSTIVSLVTSVVVFAIYAVLVFQRYHAGDFDPADVCRFWGAAILILVPVQIVAQIIAQVVFGAVNLLATQEEYPDFSDEMDNLIELRSTRNLSFAFFAGFFLAVGSLVIDSIPSETMLIILFFAMVAAAIVGDLSKLYYYRRGF